MIFDKRKRIETEFDYTRYEEVVNSVNHINNMHNNRYEHSRIMRALYDNDINYLQQNHRNVLAEFNNGNYRDKSDLMPSLSAAPDETLKEFRRLLNDSRQFDRETIREIDELKEQGKYLDVAGDLKLQKDLTLTIDEIIQSRDENKLALLKDYGIPLDYNDGLDPFKKTISEMAHGVKYELSENEDGSYTMDVQQGGSTIVTAKFTQDGPIDLNETLTYYDRTENFDPEQKLGKDYAINFLPGEEYAPEDQAQVNQRRPSSRFSPNKPSPFNS